jgi:DNA replication and repair protein RecF
VKIAALQFEFGFKITIVDFSMLTALQLKDFRFFASLALQLSRGFNFFIGANGEGKTSILEASCTLLRLQSQRISTLTPLIKVGAKSFAVRGRFDGHLMEFRYGGLRRRLRFDDIEQRSATEYLRVARVVSFANIDIEMVRGSAERRRRYLDFIGTQIDARYRPTLRSYERALRARNALLKSARPHSSELAAYDPPLISHGTQLQTMRARIVERLAPFVAAAHAGISNSKEKIDIDFAPGNEADFATDVARSREEETRLRQTVVGPHRDDVDFSVDGMSALVFASEGQQRTLALALKIAQARIFAEEGAAPLLLIDDIFGELDPNRRNALLVSLPVDSQKLVTATTLQWREGDFPGSTFQLNNGRLTPL